MAAPTTSSFQKKLRNISTPIPGTKPSLLNSQLLVSTGVPSLDALLGGGMAVGTVLLIEEDTYGSYSSLMLKLFLADAVANQHELFIASNDELPQNILKELPCPITYDPPVPLDLLSPAGPASHHGSLPGEADSHLAGQGEGGELQIAWRYQNLQISQPAARPQFGLYFDLTKTFDPGALSRIKTTLFSFNSANTEDCGEEGGGAMTQTYSALVRALNGRIADGQFDTTCAVERRNILRIGIQGLGSPQWGGDCEGAWLERGRGHESDQSAAGSRSLLRCLYALRCMLRSAYAACVVTVPTHLCQSGAYVARLRGLCDAAVRLESFAGTALERHAAYKDYHGLFHVVKLPRLNSLSHHNVDTDDLAFKLRRKRFSIEKLHLPPSLQENVDSVTQRKSREVSGLDEGPELSMGCGTAGSLSRSKLDF